MRRSFERSLEQYREVAQEMEEAKKPDAQPLNITHVERELEFMFERNAKTNKTEKDTQSAIFEMQRFKQEIMTALHEELQRIDAREQREVGEGQRFVRMEGEMLIWDRGDGQEPVQMTLGELLTDGEWGLEYVLDVESVPRQIQKKYAIGEAKRQLLALLNEQIVLSETGRSDIEPSKAEAYEGNLDLNSKLPQAGFIAERGVGNFLKKLSIDLGVDIEVVDATVYHDVEQKVDFMVKIGSKKRGVEVGEHNQQYVGFQFTTNTDRRVINRKLSQIRKSKKKYLDLMKLDDIVLVAVPIDYGRAIYRNWEDAGSLPGGPDSLWSNQIRELITRYVLASPDSPIDVDDVVGRLPATKKVSRSHQASRLVRREPLNAQEKRDTKAKPPIREAVCGCDKYYVKPELLQYLAQLGAEKGVDLQQAFQEKLNSLEGDITPKRMVEMLNRILRHNGLESLDHRSYERVPDSLKGSLGKLQIIEADVQKSNYLATVLFPVRPKKKRK